MVAIYLTVSSASAYAVSLLKIDFKTSYFISSDANIKDYLDKRDLYYNIGETITIYTDGTLDLRQEKV